MTEQRYAVVIEDDVDARELTELVLTQSGFTVVTASDGPSGIDAVREYDPLITTCDVQMPGMDGFAVTKRIREFSLTYLIMVTSMAGEIDIIQGFESGADDYLVKPFRPRELRARADAMLRRMRLGGPHQNAGAPAAAPPAPPEATSWAAEAARELRENPLAPAPEVAAPAVPPPPQPPASPVPAPAPLPHAEPDVVFGAGLPAGARVLEHAGIVLDPTTGRTTYRGRALELTHQELDLLSTLLQTGRRVRSKADLVLALRGQAYVTSHFVNEADKRQVDAHIASLRAKLGDDAADPQVIETVRGVGYRLAS